jgi:putative Mn2+ efflux pump MntP
MLSLLALTLPLCLDSFLIAAAIGITRPSWTEKIRISLLFALFEAGMPLIGLVVGHSLSDAFGHNAAYLAAVILIGFGLWALSRQPKEDEAASHLSRTQGWAAVAIGLSISLDGLAIGFTYGLLKVPTLLITVLIAGQAILLTQLGFAVGNILPDRLRQRGEQLAGLVLALIGVFILLRSLLA